MPLSEFYGTSKGKVEDYQQKNLSGVAVVPNNGVVELVCKNGHVLMQDQSSSRKIPKIATSNNFFFQTPRFLDKDIVDQTASKVGEYRSVDSVYSDIPMSAPPAETGLNQEDDMLNWFNYPIDDTLQQDYCSDFQPELSGVTVNDSSIRNSIAPVEKRDRYNQVVRYSHNGSVHDNVMSMGQGSASKLPSSKYASLYPWSLQGQPSASSVGSRVSDIMSSNVNNMQHHVSGNLVSSQPPADHFSQMKMHKQDSGLPRSNPGLLNFSHFSRPAAMARATIQNASSVSALASSGADRMIETDKVLPASCRNPAETTQVDPNCVLRKEMNYRTQPNLVSTKVDSNRFSNRLETISLEESLPGGKSDTVYREDANNNDKSPNQDGDGYIAKGVPENEKAAEPAGASSSLCSGNSVEKASIDLGKNLKRKNCRDIESEGQSEDVEEESVGVKKAAPARGGSGSKRSRAAEVHNLSERRRRDRINEKMRALQELIPNCNKVDKASMLDEAIEYLKTLQLQVQILSMGAGMYMPQMMLPPGMQHIHAAHLPHFSPMGARMGMGMGFGMNMVDMNGGPSGCSMIPVSHMQGSQFPSPPMSGSPGFQAGANLQGFSHPSQGIPMSVAGPMVPMSRPPPINAGTGTNSLKMAVNMEALNAIQAANMVSKNLTQNTNVSEIHNADASISVKHQSTQFNAANGEFDQSTLVPKDDQGPYVGGDPDDKSTKKNDGPPSREAGRD